VVALPMRLLSMAAIAREKFAMHADNVENREQSPVATQPAPRANLALALVVFSWCAWMVFQTVQFVRDRNHLTQLKANQETPFQEATKVRTQVEATTADTVKLAAAGNVGAQRIVAELRKRGFKLPAESKPAPPAKK
jgi:hypothetical protein